MERMVDLFREKPEWSEGGREVVSGPGELEFVNVSVSYEPGRPVLKRVSIRIPAGKTVGLVGTSGAGKSTIVRVLVRLMEPDEGAVLLDGVPIRELSLSSLRNAIAVVPQDTILFNDTIAYNIAIGRRGSSAEEVRVAANIAHMDAFVMNLPNRYQTLVGERGVKLSGGEKQRVSVARAAIRRPKIYVFDEATSSLDSRTEREILRNLEDVSRNNTTLIIAHRLSTVIHAHNIIVLENGIVAEQGTHGELVAKGGRYAELWAAQGGQQLGSGAVASAG
jgi:ATP-binding cassette, subfamily B, heavy metal transporter